MYLPIQIFYLSINTNLCRSIWILYRSTRSLHMSIQFCIGRCSSCNDWYKFCIDQYKICINRYSPACRWQKHANAGGKMKWLLTLVGSPLLFLLVLYVEEFARNLKRPVLFVLLFSPATSSSNTLPLRTPVSYLRRQSFTGQSHVGSVWSGGSPIWGPRAFESKEWILWRWHYIRPTKSSLQRQLPDSSVLRLTLWYSVPLCNLRRIHLWGIVRFGVWTLRC